MNKVVFSSASFSHLAVLHSGYKSAIVERIDHIVLTIRNIEATIAFYISVMGMERMEFGGGRLALGFGQLKINLHELGNEFEPKAGNV